MTKNSEILNNEAYEAYQTLNNHNDSDKQEVIQSLDNFRIYLESLSNRITKNPPKIGFIYQWVFSTEYKEKDLDEFCKANIFAAKESLKRIIPVIQKKEITPVFRRMLIDFICDLKMFVNYFDKSQNYEWLIVNTNTHISNFYYDLAQNVFYNGKPGAHEEEYFSLSSSTPFIIRQSIEYKIKRVLGIEYIELSGKPHKTLANVYFKAIRNNNLFYRTRKFDFETIEKIHSWTHLHIHSGYRAKPWVTETALNYLKEFFYSGITSQATSFSLFAGVEIVETDLQDLIKQTEDSIKNELGQDAVIIWRTKPELAYLRNKSN
jgi:hypothetical protein